MHSRSAATVISLPPHIDIDSSGISRDFNDNSKTTGFLNHEVANFTFNGPDRQIQKYNDIEAYMDLAKAILDSGVPNYKFARFPLHSGLNISAWDHYLRDYHDKFPIQYLTYGFPLSTVDFNLSVILR